MNEPRKSLRRHIGFVGAVSMGCAAALYPSDVAGASTLHGLVIEVQGAPVYGSIDPATGSFTRIGSASVPEGHYAPVFDPARHAFYLTSEPIDGSLFSGAIDEIDATTGALTQISLPPLGGPLGQYVAGLGVDTNNGQLHGLVIEVQGAPVFGSIDPTTGSFTRIGSASVPEGHYAPVFDPARNAFYLTSEPIDGSLFSGATIDRRSMRTHPGALTQISLPPLGGPLGQYVAGLGVDTNNGQLYGLVIEVQGDPVFGSIDPATGSFTRIGSASVAEGHYAPVFDPARNAFYFTSEPIDGSLFSGAIDEIDATTGALTQISLPPIGGPLGQYVAGLGVASASTSTPEPTSIMQLLTYIFGMAVVIRRTRMKI